MSNVSQPVEKASVQIRTNEYLYEFEPDKLEFQSGSSGYGGGIAFSGWTWGMTVTKREEEMDCKIPELYPENLLTLQYMTDKLADLAMVGGVFEVEIRVRFDDLNTWAVIGYGEAGDPCVLRFEKDA